MTTLDIQVGLFGQVVQQAGGSYCRVDLEIKSELKTSCINLSPVLHEHFWFFKMYVKMGCTISADKSWSAYLTNLYSTMTPINNINKDPDWGICGTAWFFFNAKQLLYFYRACCNCGAPVITVFSSSMACFHRMSSCNVWTQVVLHFLIVLCPSSLFNEKCQLTWL